MILENLYIMFCALTFSVLIHEIAHYKSMKALGRSPELRYTNKELVLGTPQDYKGLSKKDLKGVYFNGIIWGFLAFAPSFFILSPIFSVMGSLLYFIGCKHDFKRIRAIK